MAASPGNVGRTSRVISEEQYYELAEKSDVRLEFVAGQIRAMAGASRTHVNIATRLIIAFGTRLTDGPCEVGASDMRVKVEATDEKFYPDIVVYCENPRFDELRPDTLLTPVVIVEILSPSTASFDLTEKLAAYRQIPTLRHYIVIEQRRVRVQHHRRLEENEWRLDIYHWRREEIALEDLGIQVPLEEIYRRLDMPEGLIILSGQSEPPEDAAPE